MYRLIVLLAFTGFGFSGCTTPAPSSDNQPTCTGKCDGTTSEPLVLAYVDRLSGDTLACVSSDTCAIYGWVTLPDGRGFQLDTLHSQFGLWRALVTRGSTASLVGNWTIALYDDKSGDERPVLQCTFTISDERVRSGEARDSRCTLADGRVSLDYISLAFRSAERYPVTIHNECKDAQYIGRSYFGGPGDEAFAETLQGSLSPGDVEGTASRGEFLLAMATRSQAPDWLAYHGEPDVALDEFCRFYVP